MRRNFRARSHLLLLLGISFCQIPEAVGQLRYSLSNLRIEMGTGYDSNLFRIANRSDSNRVEAPIETLAGRSSWRVNWKRGVATSVLAAGQYSYYPGNAFANEWQWSAKTNTSIAVKRRASGFFPATSLDIGFGAAQIDQIFTNRELGGESFQDVNEIGIEMVGLGDLFDRKSYFFSGGIELKFSRRASLSLGYNREIKDYADIGDPATPNFYSLDNAENNLAAGLDLELSKLFRIKLRYGGEDRQYDYRLARGLNGVEAPDRRRRYWTNAYSVSAIGNAKRVSAKIGASIWQRQDRFQGYYNSLLTQLDGDLAVAVSSSSQITVELERAWKDYERVTISGNLLSNRYFTFKAGINFAILKSLALQASFIHDRESSTNETFNYNRNIGMAVFKYSLD
jgi:hypothetical protein